MKNTTSNNSSNGTEKKNINTLPDPSKVITTMEEFYRFVEISKRPGSQKACEVSEDIFESLTVLDPNTPHLDYQDVKVFKVGTRAQLEKLYKKSVADNID